MATRAMLWSFGASIQDKDENVVLNSEQTVKAVEYGTQLFREVMTPAVLSWNAASNNQALNARQTAYILNSISAYRAAQDNRLPVAPDIFFTPALKGPTRAQVATHVMGVWVVWKFARYAAHRRRRRADHGGDRRPRRVRPRAAQRAVGRTAGHRVFLTYLIPPTLLFIPFSRVIALLGLENSPGALVLVYPTFTIPFCTWLMMGFFRSIPRDIEEQAMIDGYSRLSAMRKVVLPLAISGILTITIFAFTQVLQDFVYALTFISSVGKMTVSLGVPVALVRGDVFYWGALMAAALITSVPIAIVYSVFIDRFIAGLTAGAVRG